MAKVALALGANLGNKLNNLCAARDLLAALSTFGHPIRQAPIYSSSPIHCPPGSPDFFNTVMEIEYVDSAQQLLEQTQTIEKNLGRQLKRQNNEARPIDIDILYYGKDSVNSEKLILPHPRITERRFVLQPLSDLSPDLILPNQDLTILQLLARSNIQEQQLTSIHSHW